MPKRSTDGFSVGVATKPQTRGARAKFIAFAVPRVLERVRASAVRGGEGAIADRIQRFGCEQYGGAFRIALHHALEHRAHLARGPPVDGENDRKTRIRLRVVRKACDLR